MLLVGAEIDLRNADEALKEADIEERPPIKLQRRRTIQDIQGFLRQLGPTE
jgi:hypothetical protein